VSRYSISFQENTITDVTPLLPEVVVRPAGRGNGDCSNGSLVNLGNSSQFLCNSQYTSDEDSECEASDVPVQPNSNRLNVNTNERPITRSFSEGTAILKYSDDIKDNQKRLCLHGNDYNDCCGKTVQTAVAGSTDLQNDSHPGHCHTNDLPTVDRKARYRLIIASVLCLFFMIGEIVGGYLADSLAIMTDAAHLLTDFASFMISLFAIYVATRPNSKRMNFGWYRAEVIGALTSVLLIWVVTGVLVFLAIQRIMNKDYDIKADIMLITSGVGVAVNIIMGATLHTHGHSHGGGSSGHSHSGEAHAEEGVQHKHSGTNLNVRAAFIHVIGDFIQSIGVFIAALIIFFKPAWGIVDPICTFLFSILVLLTTFAIMKDTLTVLMEGLPKGVDFNDVHKTFFTIEGVVQVHNLRIWSLSMDKIALSAHVVVDPGTNPQDVLKRASQIVREKYSFFEMTLQIEDMKEEMNSCAECKLPV